MTFLPDGRFQIDVLNDPDWTVMRLEPFAGGPLSARLTPEQRDARLKELEPIFWDRVVLFFDKAELRPTVQYLPHGTPGTQPDPPGTPKPSATMRLTGSVPPGARVLQFFYGIVLDPYPLVITAPDGHSETRWVKGDEWSGPIDMPEFVLRSRWNVTLQYFNFGYRYILTQGFDHVLFAVGLAFLTARARSLALQIASFVMAHSIALGLALYASLSLPNQVVEPLVLLSIAYVAIATLMGFDRKPWQTPLVVAFGIFHGIKMSAAFLNLGMPRSEFFTALVSFNLGIDAALLTVSVFATVMLSWFRSRRVFDRQVALPASLLFAGIFLYSAFGSFI